MPLTPLLAALALGLMPLLAPSLALAAGCETPAHVTCPAGHSWDPASMLCLPPSA